MKRLGNEGLSPVARFSIALGAILLLTAIALSAGSAYLFSRYVADETTKFTQDAVASHFGTVFEDDVFQRGLSTEEVAELTEYVTFHFSIYNVVATQFFDRTGKIVFSYDGSEIGRQIDPATLRGLDQALRGMRSSTRTSVIADPRLAVPGSTIGYGTFDTHHMDGMTASGSMPPGMARLSTLEAWIAVKKDAQVVGGVVVWRDMTAID